MISNDTIGTIGSLFSAVKSIAVTHAQHYCNLPRLLSDDLLPTSPAWHRLQQLELTGKAYTARVNGGHKYVAIRVANSPNEWDVFFATKAHRLTGGVNRIFTVATSAPWGRLATPDIARFFWVNECSEQVSPA